LRKAQESAGPGVRSKYFGECLSWQEELGGGGIFATESRQYRADEDLIVHEMERVKEGMNPQGVGFSNRRLPRQR
jgi:hypothetical protein